MTFFDMVEIFKTDVPDVRVAENISKEIRNIFPVSRIIFDLEDCDKILKIVAYNNFCIESLITTVKKLGFNIEVLEE